MLEKLKSLREYCADLGLVPSEVVLAAGVPGCLPFAERIDLRLIHSLLREPPIKWVAWLDPSQVAREHSAFAQHQQLVALAGADLRVASLGHAPVQAADWRVSASATTAVGDTEARNLRRRTKGGHARLENLPYGFRVSRHGGLETDPDAYRVIQGLFYRRQLGP
jgi:hypothetical protein